jgi:hypothetical protein
MSSKFRQIKYGNARSKHAAFFLALQLTSELTRGCSAKPDECATQVDASELKGNGNK